MAEEAPTIESQVQTAMRSRVSYFKEQSDSLTFEGVRRLLEKDLGLEKCALDVHKRVIKQLLLECIGGADDDNAPKNSGESESVGKPREETAESEHQLKKDVEDEKMEDSPVLGLMTGSKTSKNEKKETESIASEVPSENTIKKAVRARASYVRENSDKVTMAGLRRLLEKDLGLDEHTLDPYKKLISAQLDEALNSSEGSESPTEVEKKKVKKGAQIKSSEKGSSDENSDASGSESEEVEEEEEEEKEKPRKKIIRKEKLQKSEPKKRKRPVKEAKVSSTKQVKLAKRMSVKKSAAEDSEHEDDNSQSSAENPVKKKEVPTSAYGKRVEHLKSVIKSCGMGVPPVIYKKVKQVSENKREAALIKELEEILSKEGLSANPSEKEIKEVRRRKERARELEGIDTSNIVSSSRRRSTTSFTAPPPKPKIPVESDHSGSSDSDDEDSDDGDDEDNEDDGDDEDNEDDGDEENGDSQSEEADDDNDEDSD